SMTGSSISTATSSSAASGPFPSIAKCAVRRLGRGRRQLGGHRDADRVLQTQCHRIHRIPGTVYLFDRKSARRYCARMARPSRIVIPGVAHHVTQRGLVKDHEEGADDEEDEVQREQIADALKQAEVSTPVAEAIRRMGI